MSDCHPDRDQLLRFLDDGMPEAESRELQRHLFVCHDCEERLIALLPGWRSLSETGLCGSAEDEHRAAEEAYRGLLKRVLADKPAAVERRSARRARERAEAGLLLRELRALPVGSRVTLVRHDGRFHSWGLFEQLVEEARQEVLEDPRGAEADFQVTVELAEHLDPSRYGPGSVEAAQARAWAWLGNAERILFDFRSAEEAFLLAEEHLERSWLDPLDEALVLELKALLRRAQRRFDEALQMLDGAIALYREVNEPHLQGRALITKGLALQYAGALDAAAAALREGLFLVDPAEDPRLVLTAHCNIILCWIDGGRLAEARALIEDLRPVWATYGRQPDLLRLRWLEGRVASGLDRLAEAEAALLEVRDGFVESGNAYDAALASLDLAAVYAKTGRTAETRRLAAEMLPIFGSREIHREALAALLFFQRAAEMEQVTQSMLGELAAYLERARANPGLRFRAGQ